MKQTQRRNTMQKRDLSKAALQRYWNHAHAKLQVFNFTIIFIINVFMFRLLLQM